MTMTNSNRTDDSLHLTISDMVYLAGTCVHGLYIGHSKNGGTRLAYQIADAIFASPRYKEHPSMYPGEVLSRLVQTQLPEMIQGDKASSKKASQQATYEEQLIVFEDELAVASNLQMEESYYYSGMNRIDGALVDALENIYANEPILIEGRDYNTKIIPEADGRLNFDRVMYGQDFFAHVEERLANLKNPPAPKENVAHSFFHNIKTLFGLLDNKKKNEETPQKKPGNRYDI